MPTEDELHAEIARLRMENLELKGRGGPETKLKVTKEGALSVYGLGRFPVTLYREQWLKLLSFEGDMRAFIAANAHLLKTKETSIPNPEKDRTPSFTITFHHEVLPNQIRATLEAIADYFRVCGGSSLDRRA